MLFIPYEIHDKIARLLSTSDCLECSLSSKSLRYIYGVRASSVAYLKSRKAAKLFLACLARSAAFSTYSEKLCFWDGVLTMSQLPLLKVCRKLASVHFKFDDSCSHQSRVIHGLPDDFEISRLRNLGTPEALLRTFPSVNDLTIERCHRGSKASVSIKHYLRGAGFVRSLTLINMSAVLEYCELDSIHAMCPNLETLIVQDLQEPSRACSCRRQKEWTPRGNPAAVKNVNIVSSKQHNVLYLLHYFAHMYPQLETLELVSHNKKIIKHDISMDGAPQKFTASCMRLRTLHLEDISLNENDIHHLLRGKELKEVTLFFKQVNIIDSSCYRIILQSIQPTVHTLRLSIARDAVKKGVLYHNLPNGNIRELELRMTIDLHLCPLDLPSLLKSFPNLQKLTLVGFGILAPPRSRDQPHPLRSLRLAHCDITPEVLQFLNHKHLPRLTTLALSNTQGGMCSLWSDKVSILDLDLGECTVTSLSIHNHQGTPVDFWTTDSAYSTRAAMVIRLEHEPGGVESPSPGSEHFYYLPRKEIIHDPRSDCGAHGPAMHYTDDTYAPFPSRGSEHRAVAGGEHKTQYKFTNAELTQLRALVNHGFHAELCGVNDVLIRSARDICTTGLVVVRCKSLHNFVFDGIPLVERSQLLENDHGDMAVTGTVNATPITIHSPELLPEPKDTDVLLCQQQESNGRKRHERDFSLHELNPGTITTSIKVHGATQPTRSIDIHPSKKFRL
ncbi:hypothetical protein BX666DRAFT_2121108 [Dichotomocladium elegans]|nr:hypothetical protein BX666DRAFT_2121108 [Dichotomocladium elegans]